MKRETILAVCLVFLSGFACLASAATYYVSPTGSASWSSCTNINTFCSLSTANMNAVAGDVVYIRAGEYTTSLKPTNSGSSLDNTITFAAYPGEDVYLEASMPIDLTPGQDYIVIDGFKSDNVKQGMLVATNANYIELKNCHFSMNAPSVSKWFQVDLENGCRYWNIHDNIFDTIAMPGEVDGTAASGSLLGIGSGGSTTTGYNYVHDNTFVDGTDHDYLEVYASDYNVVKDNTFYNTGAVEWICSDPNGACPNGPGEVIVVWNGANYNVFEGNIVYETGGNLGDRHLIAFHQQNSNYNIYRRNILYNLDGVSFNFFLNSLSPQADVIGNRIYNNIMYNTMSATEWQADSQGPISFYNYWDASQYKIHDNKVVNNIISISGRRAFQTVAVAAGGVYSNEFFGNWIFNIAQANEVWRLSNQITLSLAEINYPSEFHDNLYPHPNPTDATDPKLTAPANGDMTLKPDSLCIDSGQWLTNITSATTTDTVFTVNDPYFFSKGINGLSLAGDVIKTQNGQSATIINIDYGTGQITVSKPIHTIKGERIALNYSGTRPDIGAIEYTGTPTTPYCGDGTCNGAEACSTCPGDCGVCPQELIAHWKLDEPSGTTAADSSGNGYDGTLVNGPIWTSGKIGNALSFDGVNDYIRNSASAFNFGPSDFSISLWIKQVASQQMDYAGIISKGAYKNSGWYLNVDNGANRDVLVFVTNQNNAAQGTITGHAIPDNTWTHIVAVRQGPSARIYINGADVTASSDGASDPADSTYDLEVGAVTGDNLYFKGSIDDVRIYDYALSDSEVQELYTKAAGSTCQSGADSDNDGVISISEMVSFISRWKSGGINIGNLIEAIGKWKNGCQ